MCRGAPPSFSHSGEQTLFAQPSNSNLLWSDGFAPVPVKAQLQTVQTTKDEFDFNPFVFGDSNENENLVDFDEDLFFDELIASEPEQIILPEPQAVITNPNKRQRENSLELTNFNEANEEYVSEPESTASWISYAPQSPDSSVGQPYASNTTNISPALQLTDSPVMPYYLNNQPTQNPYMSSSIVKLPETPAGNEALDAVEPLVREEVEKVVKPIPNGGGGGDQVRSKYKGVRWYKRTCKWVVQIRVNGQRKHIGYFDEEEEAGKAYALAIKQASSGSLDNVNTKPRKTKKSRK